MKNVAIIGVLLVAPLFLTSCFDSDDDQPDLNQKFLQETAVIDEFLQDNGITAEIDPFTSLRYEPIIMGSGLAPYIGNSVNMTYTTYLLETGETVDSGTDQTILWENLIAGLQLGLRNVQEAGRIRLYVPSVLAYGESGDGDIPPNANLVYDITLNSFDNPRLKSDVSYIQSYLNENELTAVRHPSGIFYNIIEQGTGPYPSFGSNIMVTYEGRIIETQEVFDGNTGSIFQLSRLIVGWQIGLQELREGGSMNLYVPSTFGYGETGAGTTIPPNTNLEFDIELNSVQN